MELVHIARLDRDQRSALEVIYTASFPPFERVPFGRLEHDSGAVVVAGLRNGQPVGFAAARWLPAVDVLFLRYLAVDPDVRGEGIGALLFDRVRGAEPMFWEVEDPGAADSPTYRDRVRRVRFYERLGAVTLPVRDYRMPNLDGSPGEQPMLLMWSGDSPPGGDRLTALVRALYLDHYGIAPDQAEFLLAGLS